MPEEPYHGNVELTDLAGRPSASVSVRGSNGIVHLTTMVNAARATCTVVAELFEEDEMNQLIAELTAARDRAIHQSHNTGAPK